MVTRFLPAMMSVVVDDHTFIVEQKLPSEEKSSLTYPTTLPDAFNRLSASRHNIRFQGKLSS